MTRNSDVRKFDKTITDEDHNARSARLLNKDLSSDSTQALLKSSFEKKSEASPEESEASTLTSALSSNVHPTEKTNEDSAFRLLATLLYANNIDDLSDNYNDRI